MLGHCSAFLSLLVWARGLGPVYDFWLRPTCTSFCPNGPNFSSRAITLVLSMGWCKLSEIWFERHHESMEQGTSRLNFRPITRGDHLNMEQGTSQLTIDEKRLNTILTQTLQHATEFLKSVDKRPAGVRPQLPAAFSPPPEKGIGAEAALKFFQEKYSAGISGSAGPRYCGFVTGGSTPAAIAGDWLVSAFDQNAAQPGDSTSHFIEKEVLGWLADMFGLTAAYSGAFVSGATMANFVGLAIARQWIAHCAGVDVAQEGLYSLPRIKILSGDPHSSIFKAVSMLGMGRNSVVKVNCLNFPTTRDAIDPAELRKVLQACAAAGETCIVVANSGTVNTGDFDDLTAIAELKKEFNFFLHVDGAFGGFAACSPLYAHFVKDLDSADSITIDAHKWLNVPYDSGMVFTRHRKLQLEVFQNSAAYLGAVSITSPEYVHLTPENSRRFRALPAWLSLMAYGKEGYRELVEQNCDMAFQLGSKVESSPFFSNINWPIFTNKPFINVVCFQLGRGNRTAEETNRFINAVNQKGETYLTPTVVYGRPAIRAAFSNWRTVASDVRIIWNCLTETYENEGFHRLDEERLQQDE